MTRWKMVLLILAAMAALAMGGCDSKVAEPLSPTVAEPESDGPTQSAVPSPEASSVELGTGTAEQVKIWKTGRIDVLSDPFHKLGCYFISGPHEQELVAEIDLLGVGSYGPPTLKKDVCYQVDVADSCGRSSIMPGLIAVEYVGPCDPPPPPSCEEEWRPECGEAPCEDEPVLVSEEVIDEFIGECQPVQGEWGPSGCQRSGHRTIRRTYKQCDTVWFEDELERVIEPCECPCVEEQVGTLNIDRLSHGGDHYRIESDGQLVAEGLSFEAGRAVGSYPYKPDGSRLCLYWDPPGRQRERIDCARASCSEVSESWHGSVSYSCETVCR